MRVLLVEDAQGMRKLIGTMLQSMGHEEIIEATDGMDAWRKLGKYEVDMVLTDWNMPGMDGLQLVEKIRNSPDYDHLPLIMFTARAAKEDVLRALQAGVDSYIAKPFTPGQLHTKIRAVFDRRARQRLKPIVVYGDPLDRDDDHPLVLFGEEVCTLDQLIKEHNKFVADFLLEATTAVRAVDERTPDYKIGYALVDNTGAMSRLMRSFKERVKMLVVSPQLPGGGITLARLASINNRGGLSIYLVCEQLTELPVKARFGLERLDVTIFERYRMHAEDFEQLVTESVVAAMDAEVPLELPPPEEIRKRIENDIRNMVTLPVLPQVYHKIIALDKDPESDIRDWVEAIETDPLSQAQIIRRARSPIYGFQGEISDLAKAVVLLGKNAVKDLVVLSAVKRSFEGIEEAGFSVEDYWLHSAGVAIGARILSFVYDEKKWTPQHKKDFDELQLEEEALAALKQVALWEKFPLDAAHDAFVGGMMHDIGKVVLIQSYPGLFPLIVEELQNRNWNLPMKAVEDLLAGGANHCMVGRILAESWKLGDVLSHMVEQHHDPAADDPFSQVIALADFAAGCIFPYPRKAAYPMTHMLRDESMQPVPEPPPPLEAASAEDGDAAPEGTEAATEPAAPTAATALTPAEAVHYFLPPRVLEKTGMGLDELIVLARQIKPTVERLVQEMRNSV